MFILYDFLPGQINPYGIPKTLTGYLTLLYRLHNTDTIVHYSLRTYVSLKMVLYEPKHVRVNVLHRLLSTF